MPRCAASLRTPLCCCCLVVCCSVGAQHFTAPIAVGAGRSLTACCGCLSARMPPLSTLTSRATHAHPTSPRSIGFCAIWGCISSSSSSLNHSMIYRVVLSCASVASRSPLPLLCMAISSALGSQLRTWWRGSAASKYAAQLCDREWTASAPASWSEAGHSGDVTVMGRRGAPRVLR